MLYSAAYSSLEGVSAREHRANGDAWLFSYIS